MAAYTRKENWGAAETFYQLVRGLLSRQYHRQVPSAQREIPVSDRASIYWAQPSLGSVAETTWWKLGY